MTAVTFKSRNKADLKPFVLMAKRLGIIVEYENVRKPNAEVFREFAAGMKGAAEEAGFKNEQDVINYCKEVRAKRWKNLYENNA